MSKAKVRPLIFRPGARYTCFGDGLCCTDLHALGPLTRSEVVQLRCLEPPGGERPRVVHNEHLQAKVLRTTIEGACVYRQTSGCAIHALHGALSKPESCRRFPYRLVATEAGGRVVTEHRCPCRTLGDRRPLDLADAEASLRVGAHGTARLEVDATVHGDVPLTAAVRVPFAEYCAIEGAMLGQLTEGEDLLQVLACEGFVSLETASWTDVGHLFRSRLDGTACSVALAWFGDALLERGGVAVRGMRDRPWSPAFDRAEARTPMVESSSSIIADWLADGIFGLDWCSRGSFDLARAELATRVTMARSIATTLRSAGVREDRAAAEAVTIVELAGASPLWESVVRSMSGFD
ncbi:MAG: hypothetical protein NVSMB1_00660 [Polyangiales bacterium]